jgi:ParB family chromosome partitioning protein
MTVIELVPFADLYVHTLNPRLDPPQAEIDALAANIRELGLIQNLAGLRDEAGRIGVIAGGRRLRALALLQDDERFALVPVKLAEDETTAAVWAAAENSLRSALHPADEIREYALLRAKGVSEAAIAIAFGVTKAHVKRRLRLTGLPEPVMAALRADKIGLTEAAAFVVCDDLARVEEVLARVSGHPGSYSEDGIKRLLKAEAVRDTDRRARFVGVPAYREAGGRISTDLFGGEVYLDDVATLDTCFAARLAEIAKETRECDRWKWVQTSDDSNAWSIPNDLDAVVLYPAEGALSEDEAARHDELAGRAEAGDLEPDETEELARLTATLDGDYTPEQRQHAGVVLYVTYGGELRATHAMVLPVDQSAAAEAGIIEQALVAEGDEETEAGPASDAPKFSEALKQDLRAVRRGARQHAALRQPDLLLDLLAFHLQSSVGRGLSLHRFAVNVTPTTETGYAPDPRLLDTEARRSGATDLARAFRAFRKRGAEHVREVLTLELARLLDPSDYGSDMLAPVFDKLAKVNPREVWTPTAENFFKRAPGAYLDALWCEMRGIEADNAEARAFVKAKKGEKCARLETLFQPETEMPADQRARVAAWLPPEML